MPILGIMASQISGHLWAPAGAYDALATVTVPSGGVASVEFAGIPSGYKHLQLRAFAKGNANIYATMRFNGDTTASNYYTHELRGSGSSATAAADNNAYINDLQGTNYNAIIIDFLDYANINKFKTTRMLNGLDNNGSGVILFQSNLWKNTAAISSIKFTTSSSTFAEYSSFALYGVK
jgi:hypothetical protein